MASEVKLGYCKYSSKLGMLTFAVNIRHLSNILKTCYILYPFILYALCWCFCKSLKIKSQLLFLLEPPWSADSLLTCFNATHLYLPIKCQNIIKVFRAAPTCSLHRVNPWIICCYLLFTMAQDCCDTHVHKIHRDTHTFTPLIEKETACEKKKAC